MKFVHVLLLYGIFIGITGCNKPVTSLSYPKPDLRILFLHHSTGNNIWYGDVEPYKRYYLKKDTCMVPRLMKEYNEKNGIKISLDEQNFPEGPQYPWDNYPYDYYNIWVKNAGGKPYMGESTLELLTKEYDIIIFKHCFPVSGILKDDQNPDINSNKKTLENYKLQYDALKNKLHEFPRTKFIVWTAAALVESQTNLEEAKRASEFVEWVKSVWDDPGDNVHLFDFWEIETGGGLFLKPEYAASNTDSHPNKQISQKASRLLFEKMLEVI
jgi:hypothetical protein